MIAISEKKECCGCSACEQICPKGCIIMKQDSEGFEYPFIDTKACINCGLCEKICPIKNKEKINNDLLECYVAYIKDEEIRLQSSSGGIFTLLAEKNIDNGGIVFGAAFDNKFLVHHIAIDNKKDLLKLRGSKYLQSRIEDTYYEAKQFLKDGRFVLYVGTACQIAGLKAYLQKAYERLYTVDVLCHGVPSPKVWTKYLRYQEKQLQSSIKSVFFRDKKAGWKEFSMQLLCTNDLVKYEKVFNKDYFMQLFLRNICLRPSCHDCKFKELDRMSDITIGDCWGIENYMPDMDDDNGTSVVLIHSKKGKSLFNSLNEQMTYRRAEIDKALPPTADSRKSVAMHPERERFFKKLEEGLGIDTLVKLTEIGSCTKIKRKVKRIINKII
ncbi:Coenzyme F420 hydrogenase/dehydrogenase, beta subunit C-terminal domain [Clostridium neonatale]|uniref:Coenzyme F420 hydrogenase/dehydrogenase, beta subunit C-terminal domain n=1 Tax=Clostridium neonatale TaxID=137838 RepID=UPI003D33A19A